MVFCGPFQEIAFADTCRQAFPTCHDTHGMSASSCGDHSECIPVEIPVPMSDTMAGLVNTDVTVTPVTETVSTQAIDGVGDTTTYLLSLLLSEEARNCYTIFGQEGAPLDMPPAFQAPPPFGADFGGTNPAFWLFDPTSQVSDLARSIA